MAGALSYYCRQRPAAAVFSSTASTCFDIGRTHHSDQSINNTPTNQPHHTTTMSGFLTFSRRALGTTSRNTTTLIKPSAAQPFSIAASRQAGDDSTHTTRKKDQLDVQSANSKEARE
jgi:hypothetical protein